MARLGDICEINMGQSPDSSSYNDNNDGLPFFQGNADFGELYPTVRVWCSQPSKVANKNDILISVRAPIGALNIADCKCCIGRGIAALTVDENVCVQKYLWHALHSKVEELNSKGTGSTFKAINKKILEETEIPLPSLDEQRKIAAVLDKISDLTVKRRRQLDKLDELVKSRFVEMFGDLRKNPKGWPIKTFDEFAKIDGNITTDYAKYANYPHIGIDSIEKITGELKGYRTVREDGVISGKYVFTPKHIIYSKIRPNLNKVALPDFDGLCSADAYPILPNEKNCERIFLALAMRSEYFLDYILQFSSRTNLPKVNRKDIAGFCLPLPPLELQKQFSAFFYKSDKIKAAIRETRDAEKGFDAGIFWGAEILMEMMQAQVLAQMSSSLVDLVVKGTASVVETKIKASKEIKDIEKLRATYDALINEVLVEREEAIRIAQAYKSELDRIVISDEDIAHLHNTVAQILEILKDLQLKSACAKGEREVEKVEFQSAIYEQIKKLISVDTLKTMQLLGFNYKEAIGEPLTQICANTITSWGNRTKTPPVSEKLKSQPNRR